jgi:hypothetical protein
MPRKSKLDELMEAVTFAEVGETDTARGIAEEIFPEAAARQRERILAVSAADGFSRRMVDHSVAMAERMGYGLVALSVPPGLARLAAMLRGRQRPGGVLPPAEFRARATERGIPFVHATRTGDPERAVAEMTRRFRRIAFLLLEPGVAPKARFAAVDLPIFTVDEL